MMQVVVHPRVKRQPVAGLTLLVSVVIACVPSHGEYYCTHRHVSTYRDWALLIPSTAKDKQDATHVASSRDSMALSRHATRPFFLLLLASLSNSALAGFILTVVTSILSIAK
jgi:hypothetical protein